MRSDTSAAVGQRSWIYVLRLCCACHRWRVGIEHPASSIETPADGFGREDVPDDVFVQITVQSSNRSAPGWSTLDARENDVLSPFPTRKP